MRILGANDEQRGSAAECDNQDDDGDDDDASRKRRQRSTIATSSTSTTRSRSRSVRGVFIDDNVSEVADPRLAQCPLLHRILFVPGSS